MKLNKLKYRKSFLFDTFDKIRSIDIHPAKSLIFDIDIENYIGIIIGYFYIDEI